MANRVIKTSKKAIIQYWDTHGIPLDELTESNFDHADLDSVCWNCADETKRTQRCHIVPASLGGPDIPSNYVLLCAECHREAPNVVDPSAMWEWMQSNKFQESLFYGNYRIQRAAKKVESELLEGNSLEKHLLEIRSAYFPQMLEDEFAIFCAKFFIQNAAPHATFRINEASCYYVLKMFIEKYPI